MKKIFLVGASGFLGLNFIKTYKKKYDIYAHVNKRKLSITGIKTVKINIVNINELKNFTIKKKIQIIINFAGLTNIEKCEKNKKEAFISNVVIPKNLKIVAKFYKIRLLHISTDQLFSGKKEQDPRR